MENYIQLYNETYKEKKIACTNIIKKELIEHYKTTPAFNEAYNDINNRFVLEKQNNLLSNNDFKELKDLFNYILQQHKLNKDLNPNLKKLQSIYKKLDRSLKFKSFKEFIIELATFDAYELTYRVFGINYNLYKMMYELGDFTEFDIKYYDVQLESLPLYKKLQNKLYPKNENIVDVVDVVDDIKITEVNKDIYFDSETRPTKKILKNNFNLKAKFKVTFIELYDHLTEFYIDKELTNKEDFKNVFTKDFNTHNSKIYFHCDVKLSYLLMDKIRVNKIFSKLLNQTKMESTGMFICETQTPFGQTSFANNIINASIEDEKKVNDTIQLILAPKTVKNP